MNKLFAPAWLVFCGFSCAPPSGGDFVAVPAEADFGARNAAWETDPCVNFKADDCAGHPMHCQCSGDDSWALVDRQAMSATFEQEISPTTIGRATAEYPNGRASLWGYYWANCGTCEQQFAFMQTMKDELKNEGFDVEFVGVMYTGADIGRFGSSPRDHQGACSGSRSAYPSCTRNPGMITLDMPVVVSGQAVAAMNEAADRGNWMIYRPDGKLFEFVDSEALEPRNGFLGDPPNWALLKGKMKAAAMVTRDGVQPCNAEFGCTHDGQWCQYDQGRCGGLGRCVTSDLAITANRSMGLIEQVCPSEGRVPVCTCSGSTYASNCDAELDQENVSHLGACD